MVTTQSRWWAAGLFLPLLFLTTHVVRRQVNDLTPWKGGGFGMFSTLDVPWRRDVRVLLELEGGAKQALPVYVAPLQDAVDIVSVEPSEANLRDLAAEVLSGCLVERPSLEFHRTCPDGSTSRRARALQIGVWRPAFEPARSALRLTLIRSARFEAEEFSHASP